MEKIKEVKGEKEEEKEEEEEGDEGKEEGEERGEGEEKEEETWFPISDGCELFLVPLGDECHKFSSD